MGAKQSKRSVDISGKEAESAGEVAAAGAGGEGRVEPIADADALKPQLNGDAHIQPPEITDKEKQLDSGTPENEKDATTEKENKVEQNDEKESTPVTNGDNEQPKEENGDSVPTPEEGKKPKKEKVKKKWSLRSISFSRKDKPKQEKKPKEEEPKLNGEPEKVPEEAAEATPEAVENKMAEEVKTEAEVKEEKTPETPVTEPLTNGSSTPESPKVETPTDEPAAAPQAVPPQEATKTETKPEQLPVNGLSLEEPEKEAPHAAVVEESKPEESTPVPTETVPVPEIPVKTEVCDAKMPLIEPTPPPLPANPPPSSVATFAATTMAPELIEASLANTTENVILAPPSIPDTKEDKPDDNETEPQTTVITNTDLAISQLSPPLKEIVPDEIPVITSATEAKIEAAPIEPKPNVDIPEIQPVNVNLEIESNLESLPKENVNEPFTTNLENIESPKMIEAESEIEVHKEVIGAQNAVDVSNAESNLSNTINTNGNQPEEAQNAVVDEVAAIEQKEACIEVGPEKISLTPEPEPTSDSIDDLPPPPPSLVDIDNIIQRDETYNEIEPNETDIMKTSSKEVIINTNHNVPHDNDEVNGIIDKNEQNKMKKLKKDALGNIIDTTEYNGNVESVTLESTNGAALATEEVCNGKATTSCESLPPSPPESAAPAPSSDASGSLPPPPSDCADADDDSLRLQESLPIADKIADLIPEIPTVPELNTETEPTSAVAVAD